MSNLLHDQVGIGDTLTLSLPYGDVVLDDSGRPVVFASAGIGIAPMAGMLSHLVAAGSGLSITLLHADRDEASFPLRRQVVTDVLASRGAAPRVRARHRSSACRGKERSKVRKMSLVALGREHLERAHQTRSGRSATSVFGGHEHVCGRRWWR